MLNPLHQYLIWNAGYLGAGVGRLDAVLRMSDTGSQHLCLNGIRIIFIDLDNLLDQSHAIFTDVVKPADEWANKRGAGDGSKKSLIYGKTQGEIHIHTLFSQLVCCFH